MAKWLGLLALACAWPVAAAPAADFWRDSGDGSREADFDRLRLVEFQEPILAAPSGPSVWQPYATLPSPPERVYVYPERSPATVISPLPPPVIIERVEPTPPAIQIESTWYTRIDYFHWNERIEGFDLVNEDGPLFTLGYVRRVDWERFRVELFGGQVHYSGYAQWDDGWIEPLSSHTDYLGARGEYEVLFEPEFWPTVSLSVGLGTRFWVRNLPDSTTASGDPVTGYQETWWTIYPYVGIEKRRVVRENVEFFWAWRIGLTAFTYQHASFGDFALYPKLGLTSQLEAGVRGRHLFASLFIETMSWRESDVVQGWLQPTSEMLTIGLRAGWSF